MANSRDSANYGPLRLVPVLVMVVLLVSCVGIPEQTVGPQSEAAGPTPSPVPKVVAPSTPEPRGLTRPTGALPLLIPVGHQPKQVAFAPDGQTLIVPLLADDGIELISLLDASLSRVRPETGSEHEGFVEVLTDATTGRFYVSQMTTGTIHEFDEAGKHLRSFEAYGRWCKVIALSSDRSVFAVSNWLSDTVSLVSRSGELLRVVSAPGARTPRGVAFEADGTHMVIAWFGSGEITRHRVADGALVARYSPGGAMRHVVIDRSGTVAYASNMARREIVVLELPELRLRGSVRVGSNPNTIQLSPDGRLLYASCRGPNHPDGYTLRSPQPGSIHVIDSDSMTTVQVIPAGTQPTGLALSPDGRLLASTSFQDDEVLVWALVDGLVKESSEQP